MLPWHEIDTVFLDMDGTLLDLHFDNHFWREHVPLRYAEKHNLDIEESKALLFRKFRLKEGTMDWYCVEYWSRELELDIVDLKMEITGLTSEFDLLVCAHDIGYPKEDPRFWSLLGDRLPFNSDTTLFIDDNLTILRTARDFGIRHLLAISRPDSKSPPREIAEFRAINGFNEIMPATTVTP